MNSSPVLPQPRLSIGQMLAGRYTLQSLASHVCGAWLAQDEIEDRPVTLQLLAPELRQDPRAWNELRRQVEICRGLDHPHIAALHELVDEPEGPAFLVLEQAEGRTLAALQQEQPQKVFSWEWLRPRLAQICQALQYAHARQAVHGAVQPENILLNRLGDVKLLHFGVSAVLANPLLSGRTHQHLLAHLSPQVIQGGAPGAADDIYSLGVTLYRALSGTTPFYGADILSQIRNSNPVPLEARLLELQIRNPLPPAASRFVLAALSKKPEVRPHDPCELIAAEKPGKPCPEEAAPGGVEAAGAENSSTAATQPTVAVTVAPTPASPVAGDRATAEEPIPKSASRRTPLTILAGAAMLGLAAGAYYWAERLRHEPPPEPSAAVESLAAPVSSPPAPLPLAAAAPAAVKNPDAKVAAPVEPGFKSLFNGRDLTGWTGDAKHWSVREGPLSAWPGRTLRSSATATWFAGWELWRTSSCGFRFDASPTATTISPTAASSTGAQSCATRS